MSVLEGRKKSRMNLVIIGGSSEVAKRMDVFAVALTHHMLIDDLNSLDLAYTPPLSSPWDPIQMSAQAWEAQRLLAS